MKIIVILMVVAVSCGGITAQNCAMTSTGNVPLNDLYGYYLGAKGGLYPGTINERPAAHEMAGQAEVTHIVPRDLAGQPSPNGKVVFLSLGMSNASQEFAAFRMVSNADPNRHPALVVVNGAQPNWSAFYMADPAATYWPSVDNLLSANGVNAQQVQAVWLKQAVAHPTGSFSVHTALFKSYLKTIVQIIRQRFPNCRVCYLSSRTYGGYANITLSPEPYTYEEGFAIRELIEDQINGDPGLAYTSLSGTPNAPWLSWGPYLWADGLNPRSDGLTWECSDFLPDGVHPRPVGENKVAQLLQDFLVSDSTASRWYHTNGDGSLHAPSTHLYGFGCSGTFGIPAISSNNAPYLGNPNFIIFLQNARAFAPVTLLLSLKSATVPVGSCIFWIDPSPNFLLPTTPNFTVQSTSAQGDAFAVFSIPNVPFLDQAAVYAEWVVLDPLGSSIPSVGNVALSQGLRIIFASP